MSIYQYKAGIQNAASYQSSGAPFVTGSDNLNGIMLIEFPNVTKEISFYVDDGKEICFEVKKLYPETQVLFMCNIDGGKTPGFIKRHYEKFRNKYGKNPFRLTVEDFMEITHDLLPKRYQDLNIEFVLDIWNLI